MMSDVSSLYLMILESGLINDQLNASVKFEPAKTYRFRLINMSGYVTFYFSIDGHELEIIEVDGVSIESVFGFKQSLLEQLLQCI